VQIILRESGFKCKSYHDDDTGAEAPSLALGDLQLELSMESTGATARESLYDEDDDR
jgi:hypothetical protein